MTQARPIVAVFGASHSPAGEPEYEQGVRCGLLLAVAGFTVATGGYGGLMEAVSAGAVRGGGHVIGVTAPQVFPGRERANGFVAEEIPAPTLTERIHQITRIAAASIALPGSLGTATELLVAWNLAFVARFSGEAPPPVVAVGEVWRRIVEDLTNRLATDGSLVTCVASVDEAVDHVSRALGSR